MEAFDLNQTAWKRGWSDTKKIWTSWQFYILDAVIAAIIGGLFGWYWGLFLVLFGMLCVWLGATLSAPIRQRDEVRKIIINLKTELEKPKLFDILCSTIKIGLPINKLSDGNYRAPSASIGFSALKIVHRGELINIIRLTMYPEIRFIRGDGQGWQTTNAIRLTSGSNFRVNPNARDFSWNTDNPQQWILTGLPLTMGKDELLPLPIMMLSVSNSNEAGILFEKSGECLLIMKFVIRTDRGSPSLPDQIISLERKDISNSL